MKEKIESCGLRRGRSCNREGEDYGNCRTCELATNWAGSEIKRLLGGGTGEDLRVSIRDLKGGGFELSKRDHRVWVNQGRKGTR